MAVYQMGTYYFQARKEKKIVYDNYEIYVERYKELYDKDFSENEDLFLRLNPLSQFIYAIFYDTLIWGFPLVFPLLVCLTVVSLLYYELKTGYMKNILMRESFSSFKKKVLKKAYSASFFIPIMYLIFFITAFIFFRPPYNIDKILSIDNTTFYSDFMYIFIIFSYSILYSIFIINITLITMTYNFKYYVSIILSYLIYIIYSAFAELVLGRLGVFLGIGNDFFSSSKFLYKPHSDISCFYGYFYLVMLIIISRLVLYKRFKNKEVIVNAAEY